MSSFCPICYISQGKARFFITILQHIEHYCTATCPQSASIMRFYPCYNLTPSRDFAGRGGLAGRGGWAGLTGWTGRAGRAGRAGLTGRGGRGGRGGWGGWGGLIGWGGRVAMVVDEVRVSKLVLAHPRYLGSFGIISWREPF